MKLVNIAVNDFGAKKSVLFSLKVTVLMKCFFVTELIVSIQNITALTLTSQSPLLPSPGEIIPFWWNKYETILCQS